MPIHMHEYRISRHCFWILSNSGAGRDIVVQVIAQLTVKTGTSFTAGATLRGETSVPGELWCAAPRSARA